MDTSTKPRAPIRSFFGTALLAMLGAGMGGIAPKAAPLRGAFRTRVDRSAYRPFARSIYSPHQGPRECARRRKQLGIHN